MKVLVDTPIWSLAFRKKGVDNTNNESVKNLIELIHDGRVAIKNAWEIFTEDADFIEYKKYIPIRMYELK